ncbi:MAG TPA: Crp/Fnr family transcriptional regulator [Jeotgalicoccus aerolatus]|nr:Crp/Fnr family transcriptional regulator [Jeotgalicoccus aerolatus]
MTENTIFYPERLIGLIKEKGNIISMKKGEYIYHPGDPTDYIYTVKSGQVFISRMQSEGIELATNLLDENGIFGAVTLFCGPKTHAASAKAKTDAVVVRLPQKSFESMILEDELIKNEWMQWMEIDRQRAMTKMRDSVMYGKLGAVCSNLIRMSNSFGETVPEGVRISVKITNQELGLMCGTSREVVSRLLGELKKERIISVQQKIITIHNIEKLRHLINCENCHIDICQVF